jgi:hypothetical protein
MGRCRVCSVETGTRRPSHMTRRDCVSAVRAQLAEAERRVQWLKTLLQGIEKMRPGDAKYGGDAMIMVEKR